MSQFQAVNLGETWESAIKNAYWHGYEAFEYSNADIIDEIREMAKETSDRDAIHYLINEYGWFVSEDQYNKSLWWGIDDFYANHMPDEVNERYQREAAVAEDIDTAFEAGAHAAILGNEPDETDVSHLHE